MTKYEKLIQYALRIIAKKRYTTFEIEKKLKLFLARQACLPDRQKKLAKENAEEETEAINAVLARLQELKYLDDSVYADDYIADRKKFRPRGKFLLARELKKKGLDADLIQNALEKQKSDESETAVRALEKKSRQWHDIPLPKQRERAYRFLSARGFDSDAIYKAISCCYNRAIE
ncbi:RecX family transcriptional regulator [Candidatus Peregrinibacteria bacterium]|nr:RecX family transcriptional regulator [Candidatus Peregrinibacteria bacterium]